MLSFEKYQGLGNDFIFVERSHLTEPLSPIHIQGLCDRHEGVGADGVILIDFDPSIQMQVYNADGSCAEMCGNALRCLYLFLKKRKPKEDFFEVTSMQRKHRLRAMGEEIECSLGEVESIEWDIPLKLKTYSFMGHFLDTGVPHVVIPVNQLPHLPVLPLGSALRHHPHFQPKGTNVNFISLNQDRVVEIRTYERGVEGETRACGTGCAAAAIVSKMLFNLKGTVPVQVAQGHILHFDFQFHSNHTSVSSLVMRGEAKFVFEGRVNLKNLRKNIVLSASSL